MNVEVIIALAIAFAVAILFGYAITVSLLASLPRHFTWVLAPGVGLGFCSLIFFLFRRPMFTVESALVLAAVWYLYRRRAAFYKLPRIGRASPIGLVLGVAVGLATAVLMLQVDRSPHGGWDGVAIWNTHARFLVRDGANWRNDIQYSYHNDYPLLTPAIAARFWRYAGEEVPEAGALAGFVLSLAGVAVLAMTVSELRAPSVGVLFAVVLVSTPFYLEHATSQYADVPLSFFILSTLALLCLYAEYSADKRILVLAGFTAGCAGWTKNEGLLFIVATCAALLLPVFRMRSKVIERFLAFATGLALPLATIVIFKASILGRNDLIEAQSNTFGKILDFSRHSMIVSSYFSEFISFQKWTLSPLIPLALFIILRGVDRRSIRSFGWRTGVAILTFILAGYYFVYVVTPLDLRVHLDSSLNRLLLQLWPSILLLAGLVCRPNKLTPDPTPDTG